MRYTLLLGIGTMSAVLFLSGCSNLVQTTFPSDEELSCTGLLHEMNRTIDALHPLLPHKYRISGTPSDVVEGTFDFPTWSLLDFNGTDRKKIDGYRMRYNYLVLRYNSKNCSDVKKAEIPSLPN